MIFDILTLIIIVVFAIVGFKTGAAKVIARLLALVCAFVLSLFLSHFLAELVYNTFIRQAVMDNITKVINDSALASASDKATALLEGLPELLSNSLVYFGIDNARIASLFDVKAAEKIQSLIMTPVVGVISIILFIILFIILLFLLKKVFSFVAKVFRLPVIRVIDSAVGLVFGLLEGGFAVYILAFLLRLAIPLTGGELYILNEAYVSSSYVFSMFYFGTLNSFVQSFIYSLGNI